MSRAASAYLVLSRARRRRVLDRWSRRLEWAVLATGWAVVAWMIAEVSQLP